MHAQATRRRGARNLAWGMWRERRSRGGAGDVRGHGAGAYSPAEEEPTGGGQWNGPPLKPEKN
eukprot:2306871-Prymnesium_polylepis.1